MTWKHRQWQPRVRVSDINISALESPTTYRSHHITRNNGNERLNGKIWTDSRSSDSNNTQCRSRSTRLETPFTCNLYTHRNPCHHSIPIPLFTPERSRYKHMPFVKENAVVPVRPSQSILPTSKSFVHQASHAKHLVSPHITSEAHSSSHPCDSHKPQYRPHPPPVRAPASCAPSSSSPCD